MYSQDAVLELVELIYAAAADRAKWPDALERLARALNGQIATLHHQHLVSWESSFAADWNMDPVAVAEYTAHFAPLNVWFTTRPEFLIEGQVFTNAMLCPDDLLIRTEFYNDWLKPHDMGQALGAMVFKSGPATTSLSIFRPINGSPFDQADLELIYVLMPHVRRACQLHNRIQALEHKGDAAADALDQLRQGVVLLDAKGNVLLVNREAKSIFSREKAVQLTRRGLSAATPSENRRLNALIHGACETGNGQSLHSGGAMQISREDSRLPLQVLVMPLRTKSVCLSKEVPVAAIFITDPEHKSVCGPAVYAQLFGLTRAEARLAEILAAGTTLKEASEQLGVAESTVKSQLKSIFAKTNTSRQSQLVRLILLSLSKTHGAAD